MAIVICPPLGSAPSKKSMSDVPITRRGSAEPGKGLALNALRRWLLAAAVLEMLAIIGGSGWSYGTQRHYPRRDAGEDLQTIARSKADGTVRLGSIFGFTLAAAAGFGILWQRNDTAHYRALYLGEAALRES